MESQRKAQCLRLLHSLHQQLFIHQRDSIIGKASCSRICQCLHIHQFFALKSFCDSRRLQHMDRCLLPFFLHIGKCFQIIYHRLCICHADYGGKSATGCCCRTSLNIFLISKAWIAKMHMGIHQSRCHHKSCCIDHFRICRNLQSFTSLHDLGTFDHHIHDLVHFPHRIYYSASSNQ